MECPHCKSEQSQDARFCTACGKPLSPPSIEEAKPAFDAQEPDAGAGADAPVAVESRPVEAVRERAASESEDARRMPAKSRAGKAVAIVAALAIVACASAGGTWYVMSQRLQSESDALNAGASKEPAIEEPAKQEAAEAPTSAAPAPQGAEAAQKGESEAGKSAYDAFVGTWKGEMVKSKGAANKTCYGASGHPMELSIASISDTGQLKAAVSVLYHGHATAEFSNDVDDFEGDSYVSFDNLTSTFDRNGFDFTIEPADDRAIKVRVVPDESHADGAVMEVEVQSRFGPGITPAVVDTYKLAKTK